MTGPRSCTVAAPQLSGKRTGPREPGCEVSLICPLFASEGPITLSSPPPLWSFVGGRSEATTANTRWLESSSGGSGGVLGLLAVEDRDCELVPVAEPPTARFLACDDAVNRRLLGEVDL